MVEAQAQQSLFDVERADTGRRRRNIVFFGLRFGLEAGERVESVSQWAAGRWGLEGPSRPPKTWHVSILAIGPAATLPADAMALLEHVGNATSRARIELTFDTIMSFRSKGPEAPLVLLSRERDALDQFAETLLHGVGTGLRMRSPAWHLTLRRDSVMVPRTRLDEPLAIRAAELALLETGHGYQGHLVHRTWRLED